MWKAETAKIFKITLHDRRDRDHTKHTTLSILLAYSGSTLDKFAEKLKSSLLFPEGLFVSITKYGELRSDSASPFTAVELLAQKGYAQSGYSRDYFVKCKEDGRTPLIHMNEASYIHTLHRSLWLFMKADPEDSYALHDDELRERWIDYGQVSRSHESSPPSKGISW